MTCDAISKLIPLYYYGELTPEEEDRVEEHLHQCSGCTREMERQRTLASSLDQRRIPTPALLLEDCRAQPDRYSHRRNKPCCQSQSRSKDPRLQAAIHCR